MLLTNTQYDALMRSYQDRQIARHRLIEDRKAEIAKLTPRMAELDAEIARVSVEEAKRQLVYSDAAEEVAEPENTDPLSPERDIARSPEEQIAALSAEKRSLLASLGYPEDYLTPPYHCPDCEDTGYIGTERCHCFQQAAIDLLYAQSSLASVFDRECFENFSLSYYSEELIDPGTGISSLEAAKSAYDNCRLFAWDFDTQFQNLFLFGDTGMGKTFLSHCVAGELLRAGHSVLYFSADRLFGILADYSFGRDRASEADYDGIFDCDLLILDDLGTEMTNNLTLTKFFVCLNERLLHQKSTLISSNLNLQDIKHTYTERISSRISSNFLVLHLFGKDIRVQQTLKGGSHPNA